ncbi:MAG: mechanosensitive ion channel family protein [Saprospiraceae bacterium]
MKNICRLITAIALVFMAISGQAQEAAPAPTLESPYNTIFVHLYYLQPDSYQPAIAGKTIYLPEDSAQAVQLAIWLKQVLDGKGLFVHLDQLPRKSDYLDSLSQPYYTPFPKQLPDVYLERIDSKWYYSRRTVAAIPALHKALYPLGTDFFVKLFPKSTQRSFLGLHGWQWLALFLILGAALIAQYLLSRILRPVIRLLARSRYSQPLEDKSKMWQVARMASFVLIVWGLISVLPLLQLPIRAMVWLLDGLEIALVILSMFLLLRVLDVVMQYAKRYALSTEQKLDEQLLPILNRMAQVVIVLGAIIYTLSLLDVNVTALIAGVSIGGLALALAAQDTVKNLIGSAMIFFDKPFQIGDWVVMSGLEGEVAEVGFRSTRLQTVDSSIVSVPNNEISSAAVMNMGLRRYRMFKTMLGVTYDTPPDLLEKFIAGLRLMIEEHPLTKKDNYLVYFHSFGDSSLNIYFRAHIEVSTFKAELVEREKLAFGILKLANALGVRFAFPSSTLYVEEFPGKLATTPVYDTDPGKMDEKMKNLIDEWKSKLMNEGA